MDTKTYRLIVVLGMHRSGTSAITRALKVLGVSLGDRMMPPVNGNNPKGFWEDIDLNALNIEVMRALKSDWHGLTDVRHSDVECLRKEGFLLRAVDLLRSKMIDKPIFGFKDPRVARLLPFWKEVFKICDIDVSYVLAVRHPLSVAKSLARRDGLEPEKSYFLWLGHVIRSLSESAGARRVLVNYDSVMAYPESEIERIGKQIDLVINPQELASYRSEFLDHELRHSVCELSDLLADPACPPLAIEVFRTLMDGASDKIQIDSTGFRDLVDRWATEFDRIDAVLRLADKLNSRIEMLDRSASDLQMRVVSLSDAVVERDVQISEASCSVVRSESQAAVLSQTLAERDAQVAALARSADLHKSQLSELSDAVAERDARVIVLVQGLTELESRIAKLSKEMSGRDTKIVGLTQEVVECEARAVELAQLLSQRDSQIAGLSGSMEERDSVGESSDAGAKRGTENGEMARALGERDTQIGGLMQALAERDARIDRLNRVIAERETQIAHMTQANEVLVNQVNALHNSTSWRLMKPARFIFRRLKDVYRIAAPTRNSSSLPPKSSVKPESIPMARLSTVAAHPLPAGFNGEFYLELNPDVRQCGMDAETHYFNHGRFEGRCYCPPDLNILSSKAVDPDKATVLVVSHDASRSGAPILSLNLVQSLSERYNVVVLLLGQGGLEEAFQSAATEVLIDSVVRRTPQLAVYVIGEICKLHNLLFALVNSIESRAVLRALALHSVPAVSLLHEFASYTRPRHAFREAFLWSAETVFSARVTMENALSEYPDLNEFSVEVVPQGRCLVPIKDIGAEQVKIERAYITKQMRPSGQSDAVVILGAGSVQLRKGVELFLECASRVVKALGGEKCRFVWIGHGFNPDGDVAYSVYLADQIRRAGLERQVVFVRETSEIEAAYQAADIFLLSSRLDPLPNVAIDAMTHGLPVVCFDKTTGIADFLAEHGLGNACVADYLDSYDLARKILAMVESPAFRKSVGDRCRAASVASFRMQDYVARLEALALSARERMGQEREDVQMICDSARFQPKFAAPAHLVGMSRELAVEHYVRSWASGIDRRKPFPGFHPGVYREHGRLAVGESDPFAAYLRAGEPRGPWSYPVISGRDKQGSLQLSQSRVALHLHVYFVDLLPEIIRRLELNEIRPDLFVSVKDEDSRNSVAELVACYAGRVVEMRVVPNRGRDIGPFMTAFGAQLVSCYDFIGHLHTKKSLDVKDSDMGANWYSFLIENLLGGETGGQMADAIVARMVEDPSIGIVFPDDPYIVGWGANRPFAEPLAARVGLSQLPDAFNFPVGTMFWARSSVVAPFINLGLSWEDYPEEPLPYDGSLLHAVERLFGLAPALNGLQCAVTYVPGVTR